MTETQEVPLTKSQKNHIENLRRRDENRRRAKIRRESVEARDDQIKKVNAEYLPKIQALQEKHREELKKIWDVWREERSKVE